MSTMLPRAVGQRVLVVDDDSAVLDTVRAVLRGGYEVEVVATAVAALKAADAHRPDVILLDLNLPGVLTGDAALPLLTRFAPVIVVTGSVDEDLGQRLLDQGAFGYLWKPFEISKLRDMVRAAISRHGRAGTAS